MDKLTTKWTEIPVRLLLSKWCVNCWPTKTPSEFTYRGDSLCEKHFEGRLKNINKNMNKLGIEVTRGSLAESARLLADIHKLTSKEIVEILRELVTLFDEYKSE